MEEPQRPLEGLLVLDLGHIYQAPYCGFLMAMAGATVIKIEPPQGEPLRGVGTHMVRVRFPRLPVLSGEYLWSAYVLDDSGIQLLDMAELVQPFTVLNFSIAIQGIFPSRN